MFFVDKNSYFDSFFFCIFKTSEIENVLQEKTDLIITRQLQSVIVRFFLQNFRDRISKSTFGPIIDPTQGL